VLCQPPRNTPDDIAARFAADSGEERSNIEMMMKAGDA
jgi:hypothetical protein